LSGTLAPLDGHGSLVLGHGSLVLVLGGLDKPRRAGQATKGWTSHEGLANVCYLQFGVL